MTDFQAPVQDMRFALSHITNIENIATFPGYEDATPDIIDAIDGGTCRRDAIFRSLGNCCCWVVAR